MRHDLVVFNETGEERRVVRDCKICLSVASCRSCCGVVSPTGIAHVSRTFGDTFCGHDATGERWWWPE